MPKDPDPGWELARADVERLEAALATAMHERDRRAEEARLAGDGVAALEQRVGDLRGAIERERAEAERQLERHTGESERSLAAKESDLEQARQAAETAEKELAATRERLEAREQHLENKRLGIEARDRRLEEADESLKEADESLAARHAELAASSARLELREEELERTRAAMREVRQESSAAREEVERERQTTREAERAALEIERELTAARARLEAREEHLKNARAGIESRDRKLAAADERLEARQAELTAARDDLIARERELEAAGTLLEAQGAELAEARDAQRELGEVRARLEAREQHLENKRAGIESRDRRLATAERAMESRDAELASRDAELERLRAALRERERGLALTEARLEKAQQRADYFKGSLVELRGGRSYRLMRVLWRLRHPFRRAPKSSPSPAGEGAAEDGESGPAPPPTPPAPRLATSSRIAGSRQTGEPLRVASILDEMSEACFAPECDLIPLNLEGWAGQLDERRPDLLLVESAWNGNGGEWQYRIAQYPRPDLAGLPALRALLDGCRERGIPTAFWNKEDPVHFERFAEAASLFDHVFTTDARCVERYRELPDGGEAGERTVTPLPFAAQPRIHNPAAAVPERSSSPCFAGAWYRDRHPDRRRSLAALLDAARPRGLVIYDRSFGGKDGAFGFPERFAPHVLGKLPYERILDVYKSHRVFLNANSVADSPTMCSRRVFELAACDTAILSTPGAALAALLGEGTVEEAGDEAGAAAALERLLGDEPERRRRARAARRKVFAEHTYAARLATIAETAGLDAPRRNGGGWELIAQPDVVLSDGARADLAAASIFAEADVIGAHPGNGAAPLEQRQVDQLDPRALLLRRELIESRGPLAGSPEQIGAQLRRWSDDGVRLYAADADLLEGPVTTPANV